MAVAFAAIDDSVATGANVPIGITSIALIGAAAIDSAAAIPSLACGAIGHSIIVPYTSDASCSNDGV